VEVQQLEMHHYQTAQQIAVAVAVVVSLDQQDLLVAQGAVVSSLSVGKIHHQMQILQSSLHLDHGSLQLVQHRLSI